MIKAQWNTCRTYTPRGQRIIAKTIPSGIVFNDIDRGIDGLIKLERLPQDAIELKEVTMFNYDHCNYCMPRHNESDLVWEGA